MKGFLAKLFYEEQAVTAIEYSLLAVLIAVVIIFAVQIAGTNLYALYDRVARCVPSGCS